MHTYLKTCEHFLLTNFENNAWIRWKKITLYLLVTIFLPADNPHKQFGPRSGPTKCRAWSESKLFDTLMVFLKKLILKKKHTRHKNISKEIPAYIALKTPLSWGLLCPTGLEEYILYSSFKDLFLIH